ncbi:hypothetical protein LK996_00005 [Lysobacter sp. A6]|uniref:Uncharacterized protein n=1 Tax=Noviluteimonas lactosilytica TaxID=2888523 RepID=A0ABS8JD67_9GAMM|nr:hypothetical protein [Lysobacter lactosilyticus]MCC8361470.1 hypothetical protein [Lysobacter lactosilyticus]
MERAFFCELMFINSAREALLEASTLIDGEFTRNRIEDERSREGTLLHYFWRARNADMHDVIKWDSNTAALHVEIVGQPAPGIYLMGDATNELDARVLFAYNACSIDEAMARIARKERPDPAREEIAGLKIAIPQYSIDLETFSYLDARKKPPMQHVPAPTEHFGIQMEPLALEGCFYVLKFYNECELALGSAIHMHLPRLRFPKEYEETTLTSGWRRSDIRRN